MLLASRFFLLLEVMDKESSILSFWVSAFVVGGVGFFLARRRWWWVLPVLALLAFSFIGTWMEWKDPFVGPAIAQEAGPRYPIHLIASTSVAAGLTLAGLIRLKRAA